MDDLRGLQDVLDATGQDAPEEAPERPALADDLSRCADLYLMALRDGDRRLASRLILTAAETWNVPLKRIYLDIIQPAMYEVGRLWETGDMSVAEEHYCTAATQLIISQLYPHLFSARRTGETMVATSVSGELHELGARMVADFFEMDGWETCYLGANTPAGDVVAELQRQRARVLCLSATMDKNLDELVEITERVRRERALEDVRILVGGYPFLKDRDLWRVVGADGTAQTADGAVAVATRLLRNGDPA